MEAAPTNLMRILFAVYLSIRRTGLHGAHFVGIRTNPTTAAIDENLIGFKSTGRS